MNPCISQVFSVRDLHPTQDFKTIKVNLKIVIQICLHKNLLFKPSVTILMFLFRYIFLMQNKVMKLRVNELVQLLVFLKMDYMGLKSELQERILEHLKNIIEESFLEISLQQKIEELYE